MRNHHQQQDNRINQNQRNNNQINFRGNYNQKNNHKNQYYKERQNLQRSRSNSKEKKIIYNLVYPKSKEDIIRVNLIPFSPIYKDDEYLLECVGDKNIMGQIGNKKIWDQKELENQLQSGQEDWQKWDNLNQKQKQENVDIDYFSWLIQVEFRNPLKNEEILIKKIGVRRIQRKVMKEFSSNKEPYGRIFVHSKFQGFGIGKQISTIAIWESFLEKQIPFDYFYDVIENNNQSSLGLSKYAQFQKDILFQNKPHQVYKYQMPETFKIEYQKKIQNEPDLKLNADLEKKK